MFYNIHHGISYHIKTQQKKHIYFYITKNKIYFYHRFTIE